MDCGELEVPGRFIALYGVYLCSSLSQRRALSHNVMVSVYDCMISIELVTLGSIP